jgi:hypothetical protein
MTEKQSFFEKKDQKTFSVAVAGLSCEVRDSVIKVFCFFFAKKKAFPSLSSGQRKQFLHRPMGLIDRGIGIGGRT